jgi:hypothetical protein
MSLTLKAAQFNFDGVEYMCHVDAAASSKQTTFKAYAWMTANVLADFEARVSGRRYSKATSAAERSLLNRALVALHMPTAQVGDYDRKLGCSCGCSPGFKIQGAGTLGRDLFVSPVKV